MGAVSVQLTVGDVEGMDHCVSLENRDQEEEVFGAQIVLRQVERLDAVSLGEGDGKVFYTQTVVEEFIKGGVLKPVLVFHLHVQHFLLLHISVTKQVLRQVDRGQ